ncbi:hypothetical protein LOY35_27500 [Pseudomonas sp. B21-028]|uniref:hypothetical protein n=1 Tax=Pseudomonas sp. B21-028 TaxID=2895480 RepID=UPI00215ECE7D|nr:hypothetical protein [Pseudomonas sp. B21-028]UVL83862.1 hypothetical protein LOY35_27500 [Pseudomonas sp. B21-028]
MKGSLPFATDDIAQKFRFRQETFIAKRNFISANGIFGATTNIKYHGKYLQENEESGEVVDGSYTQAARG